MKTFNTAGTCRPNEHYMVDITERLEIILPETPVEIASPLHEGYLLSFCFNKNKPSGLLSPVKLNGRTLIEAI